jgi:nucleoid-associated protein YgaU
MGRCRKLLSVCLTLCMPLYDAIAVMTYDQYETQLTQALEREKTAKQQIAGEQSGIESLKGQIADLEQKIAALQTEKYSILRITEADAAWAQSEIASIAQALDELEALLPEDLLKRKNDVGAVQARIEALKRKPVTLLWKIRDRVGPLSDRFERIKARLSQQPPAAPVAEAPTSYLVKLVPGNRESLSRIASYDFIYGSAVKWPTLYRSNQSIIDKKYDRYVKHAADPKYSRAADLIYPGQVLDIPR